MSTNKLPTAGWGAGRGQSRLRCSLSIKVTTRRPRNSGQLEAEQHPVEIQPISLDQLLANEEMYRRIVTATEGVDLVIRAVDEWEGRRPSVRVTLANDDLSIKVQVKIHLRKAVTVAGGVIGATWAVVAFVSHNWLAIKEFVEKLVPGGP